jgi:hypothetical protein
MPRHHALLCGRIGSQIAPRHQQRVGLIFRRQQTHAIGQQSVSVSRMARWTQPS